MLPISVLPTPMVSAPQNGKPRRPRAWVPLPPPAQCWLAHAQNSRPDACGGGIVAFTHFPPVQEPSRIASKSQRSSFQSSSLLPSFETPSGWGPRSPAQGKSEPCSSVLHFVFSYLEVVSEMRREAPPRKS